MCKLIGTQEESLQPETTPTQTDALTTACIGIIAYTLANFVHEGLGHGGACLITGGRPLLITAVNMDCSADNRLVIAGGTVMNAAAAGLFLLIGRNTPRTCPNLKYFAWLSMTVNLLDAAGYLAFSGIGGFGDWAMFIQGFSPQWAWRTGLSIVGVVAYVLCSRWSLLELRPMVGSSAQRYLVARRLCLPPYLAGGTVECIAGAFNPQGWFLVVMSAAAPAFGGKSALIWGPEWLRGSSLPAGPDVAPIPIRRNWAWIVAGIVIGVCFVLVLGPGVFFRGAHP
ncbi:MAG TPA: hypothetical protein VKU19_31760 [Bryobacteraceae bacterium]|nr:hypothetical protein [Bryobacteraceae bacterium]